MPVLFAVIGAPGIILMTGLVSALQQAAPPERTGRVFGALTTTFAAGQALGMVTAGVLGDPLGVVALLNVQAGLYALAGVTALGLRPRAEEGRRPPSGETGVAESPAPGGLSRTHSAIAGGCNRRASIRATPHRCEAVSHTECMSTPAHVE